jgi:hypothetical protein
LPGVYRPQESGAWFPVGVKVHPIPTTVDLYQDRVGVGKALEDIYRIDPVFLVIQLFHNLLGLCIQISEFGGIAVMHKKEGLIILIRAILGFGWHTSEGRENLAFEFNRYVVHLCRRRVDWASNIR